MKQPSNDETADAATGGAATRPAEEGPRSFSVFMGRLSDGEAEQEASLQLFELGRRLQEQVHLTRAKAKGKLKISISLIAETNGTVALSYTVDTVAPKRPTTPALFWMTKGGNLSATDTRQLELRPRDVPSKREVRETPAAAPAPTKEV